jgi:hypothetical protein
LRGVPQTSSSSTEKGKVPVGKVFFLPVLTSRVGEFCSGSVEEKSVDFYSGPLTYFLYWCGADYFLIFG